MSDRTTEEIKAELRASELSDLLIAAKADPNTDPDELRDVKLALRAARGEYRTLRSGRVFPGTAVPATVGTAANVETPGD